MENIYKYVYTKYEHLHEKNYSEFNLNRSKVSLLMRLDLLLSQIQIQIQRTSHQSWKSAAQRGFQCWNIHWLDLTWDWVMSKKKRHLEAGQWLLSNSRYITTKSGPWFAIPRLKADILAGVGCSYTCNNTCIWMGFRVGIQITCNYVCYKIKYRRNSMQLSLLQSIWQVQTHKIYE